MQATRHELPWIGGIVIAAVAATAEPRTAALVFGVVLAAAVWRWPMVALQSAAVGILCVRPSLDIFGERRFDIGPLAANPAVVFGVAVLIVCAVLAVHRLRDSSSIWPDRRARLAHEWLAAACMLGLISGARLYGTVGLVTGTRELVRVASIVSALLIVSWWAEGSVSKVRLGWAWLLAGAVAPVMVALWQLGAGTGNRDLEDVNRVQGTFSHPNSFGVFLVPYILVLVAGIPGAQGKRRLARVIVAVGLTTLVVLSFSRTALLVLGAALVMLPLLQARRFGWVGLRRGMLVIGLLAIVGWLSAGRLIRARFDNLSIGRDAFHAAAVGESENSFQWRLINWGVLIQMGRTHAWAGHGSGMTTVLNPLISSVNGVPFNAHDDFVRFFFETGLLGLGAYLLYCIWLCNWALAGARSTSAESAPVAYGVAASVLAMFLLSLGTPEISLNTAILYEVYGMLALSAHRSYATSVASLDPAQHRGRLSTLET